MRGVIPTMPWAMTTRSVAAVTATAALSAVADWPAIVAVTRTASSWPASPAAGVYSAPVAPAMGSPSRSHWRLVACGIEDQVPVSAVRVAPTAPLPAIAGAATDCGVASESGPTWKW